MKSFIAGLLLLLATTGTAQVVNFEDTWLEFLSDSKVSNVSKLPEPAKSETQSYLKYNLMYANSKFCEGKFADALTHMSRIKEVGADKFATIEGFEERYTMLSVKMDAFLAADKLWKRFLENKNVTLEDLAAADEAIRVCEKGTLAKFSFMQAYAHYCNGDIEKATDRFENYTLKIVDKTTLRIESVQGLKPEVEKMRQVLKALKVLDVAWAEYLKTGISKGFDENLPEMECYSIPSMKAYMLIAAADICKNGAPMLANIQRLQKTNTHPLGEDLDQKIKWLTQEVGTYNGDLATLEAAWTEFLPSDKLKKNIDFSVQYCDKEAQIRLHLIEGTLFLCEKGAEMLAKVAAIQTEFNPTLQKATAEKLANLQQKLAREKDNIAVLNREWQEFLEKDTLQSIKFGLEYCNRADVVRAMTLKGLVLPCTEGAAMLERITEIRESDKMTLDETLVGKINELKSIVTQQQNNADTLQNLWKQYVADGDTLTQTFTLAPFYCDKIAQVKSWIIKGNVESCINGQRYLDLIDAFTKVNKLTFDKELSCRLLHLRAKVWDCRYWEIVQQARKETHEERERFGPQSAEKMYSDLNGAELPCETKVTYNALGTLGIKYVITTYLCQNIDLAKMGDPEYYQKIAAWVDTEVLKAYCETNMRCKKDFFIYLEGHTDGNPFSGASYKQSLEIPQGTPFRHFVNGEVSDKTTDRNITTSLKNNMELGIARAWTVRNQLSFMGVPISIGTYEHPKTEKGGEFRRVSIELNITNLLLDFYEKRLATLLEASGIGARPKVCE